MAPAEFPEQYKNESWPTVYLHIGTPKTGSTAIQNYGIDHYQELAKNGVYYYPHDFINTWYGRGHHYPFDIISDQRAINRLTNSGCHSAIISAEGMAIFGTDKIRRITEYFIHFNVKVIVYIRRQDDFFHSLYNQFVKWRYFSRVTCNELAENVDSLSEEKILRYFNIPDDPDVISEIQESFNVLDYYALIKKWVGYIGADNIIVRVYQKDKLFKHDVVADFFHIFGLDLDPDNASVNSGLSDSHFDFLFSFNKWKGTIADDFPIRFKVAEIVWHLHEQSYDKTPVTANRLNNTNRQQLIDRFAVGNNNIGEEFLNIGSRTPFSNNLPVGPEPTTKENNEDFQNIAFNIIQYCLAANETMEKKIKRQYETSSSWIITRPMRSVSHALRSFKIFVSKKVRKKTI